MKVLALFYDLPRPDEVELKKLEDNDETPRASLFRTQLPADILDGRMLERVPEPRRTLYRLLPTGVAQVIEAFIIQEHYDAVLSWYEKAAFSFALLCKLTGRKSVPHVAMCSWPGKGFKALMIRLVHSHIDRFILWSTVQRSIVVNTLNVSSAKIAFLNYYVDQKFFRPLERETDMICSVGSEMRDFPTFLESLRGLDIPCHIAAGTLRHQRTKWVTAVESANNIPPNVTVGKKTSMELRKLYARSRFVVIPLLPSDTDNGITCILEAFAMGKPVICSRTRGQVDVIKEGETGFFVPVGDPVALQKAILRLWENPDEAERMGEAARKYIEEHQTLDKFVGDVKHVVEATIAFRSA
jgi:glycosyltransferase involved in cell wall biosynthesis